MLMLKKLTSIIIVLFTLSSCGPTCETTHIYNSPKNSEGKFCINSCDESGNNCSTTCTKKPISKSFYLPRSSSFSNKSSKTTPNNKEYTDCLNFCTKTRISCINNCAKKNSDSLAAIKTSRLPTKNNHKNGQTFPTICWRYGAENCTQTCTNQYNQCPENCVKATLP